MHRRHALRVLLSLAVASALFWPAAASAVTNAQLFQHQQAAADARKKAAEEQKKADALVAETRRLEDQIQVIEGEVAALEGQIGTASQRRQRLEQEIDLLRASIAGKQQEIVIVKGEYEQRTDVLEARVDATYRAGDWIYIDWLLSATDLPDLLERTDYVTRVIEEDQSIAHGLDDARVKLEEAEQNLNRTLEEVAAKKAEVQAEERRLRGLHTSRDNKLKQQESVQGQKQVLLVETKENIARLKALADAEDRESARIAAELRRGSSRGSGKYAGTMAWPVPGYERVGSQFGMRMHPILHYVRMHAGIDVSAPSGAQLVSVGSGTVISAGRRGGYGNCVMIDHGDGLVSVYAHMKSIAVRVGQTVTTGASVGTVGSTGLSTGPHLHFEVRVNGNPVNPLDYL
jgi:murein DD-endopeptidase MepM/ murein hydrolase activator NlpD